MLGFKTSQDKDKERHQEENQDVAKLFFDSFSKRVAEVEGQLGGLSSAFEKLKLTTEKSQISDLILLERIQKAERMIRETLLSLQSTIEESIRWGKNSELPGSPEEPQPGISPLVLRSESAIASHILSPTGELGSLSSITTATELQVLTLLASEGPKSAPEIGKTIGRSREHTARMMKKLFQEGYIRRDPSRIPFRYSVVERLKQTARKEEIKVEEKEPISVPQT